jgi:hypothetical protein
MKRALALAYLTIALAALAGFSVFAMRADLAAQGRYWIDVADGLHWIQKLTPGVKALTLGLTLFAVPAFLLLVLGGAELGLDARLARALDRMLFAPRRARFLAALCGLTLVATQLTATLVVRGVPLSDDEDVYLFQARVLATGHLTAPPPGPREFFDNVFLVNDGRLYGQYPLGHALALVPGVWIGRPSLAVSLLAALSVALLYFAALRIAGEQTARLAALLLTVSPWFLATSGTLLSQTTALALYLGCAGVALTAAGTGNTRHAAAAGLLAGLMIHVRPIEAGLWGGPVLLYLLARLAMAGRLRVGVVAIGAGFAVPVAAQLALNAYLNGSPWVPNYIAAWRAPHPYLPLMQKEVSEILARGTPLGFGKILWGIVHTPARAAWNTVFNLLRVDLWLFGSVLSLVPAIVAIRRRAVRGAIVPLAAPVVLAFAFYFFYFWPGISDTGPVHYYLALPLFALLTARALIGEPAADRATALSPRAAMVLVAGIVVAGATFVPVQVRALSKLATDLDEPYRTIRATATRPALVFFEYYVKPAAPKGWHAGRRNHDPRGVGDFLYALDRGVAQNARLVAAYPDRTAYRFRYERGVPTLTKWDAPPAMRLRMREDGRIVPDEGVTP